MNEYDATAYEAGYFDALRSWNMYHELNKPETEKEYAVICKATKKDDPFLLTARWNGDKFESIDRIVIAWFELPEFKWMG